MVRIDESKMLIEEMDYDTYIETTGFEVEKSEDGGKVKKKNRRTPIDKSKITDD